MKGKLRLMWRGVIALVLVSTLGLVMAVPVSATHDSTADIDFDLAESTVAGEDSILDVVVTNTGTGGDCAINIVKIDFSESAFIITGSGIDPTDWTGEGPVNDVVTYTAATGSGIVLSGSEKFSPAVTNPPIFGEATVPAVSTTDIGAKAAFVTTTAEWISYEADLVGVGGNAITVKYVNPNSVSSPLSVSVDVKAITVSLKTDDGGDLTSEASGVAAEINGHGVAGALVTATADTGHLDHVVQPTVGVLDLTGGISPNEDKDCPVLPETLTVTSVVPDSFEVVAGAENKVTAGEAFSVKITAFTGETIETKYAGNHFISFLGSVGTGTIPDFELISFENGVGTSPANFILTDTTEAPTIKATDNDLTTPATGTSLAITVNPRAFSYFTIDGEPLSVIAGAVFTESNITVTAYNADVEIVDDYTGMVSWTSTDENAELPDPYTFTAEDNGIKAFDMAGFTLNTAGYQTITVTDGTESTTSAHIIVNPAAAASMVVTASPDVIVANGTDEATITATFLDKFGNVVWVPLEGVFESSLGTITDITPATPGVDTATLISDKVGTATIRVTSGSFDETTTVKLLPVIATVGITVTVDEDIILNDGVDERTITATYKDADGTVTAADGADYKVTFTTAASNQDGSFDVTGGTLTIVPDTGDVANTGTVSGALTGATIDLLGDFTAELTLVTTFEGLLPPITDAIVISGTITATTMTFSGTITADVYPDNAIVADTLSLTTGTITVAAGGVTGDLTGTGFTADIPSGSMVVGVTLSAASVDPVAGVAIVTLTTVADPATAITVTANGIGATTDNKNITVTAGSFKILLFQGWNLISLPLVPTDPTIDTVLADLIEAGSVDWVDTFIYEGGQLLEKKWDPPAILQNTLMNDGQGYWVNMNVADVLVFAGSELPAPPAVPPTYKVYEGWNLIGFTELSIETPPVDYLGPAIVGVYLENVLVEPGTLEAMYGYNAVTERYFIPSELVSGKGYWLAVNADGKIYPSGGGGAE